MKKIAILIIIIHSLSSCAQGTYPLNTMDVPNNSYIKDIDNELDPFLGTWEGIWNNKKITITFSKIYHRLMPQLGGINYFEDFVIGKYVIVDLNTGVVLEDTTSITNMDNITIKSHSFARQKNMLRFGYVNKNLYDCGFICSIYIYRDLGNPNILTYKFKNPEYNNFECPNITLNEISINIPKQDLVLNRL